MKFRQSLLTLSILLSNYAYSAVTINVNTTNDEFGENLANCSLREAIEAVNTRNPFGGCRSGERFGTNRIVLEDNEYILTRGELVVKEAMVILGANKNDQVDNITQTKPKRTAATTTINAQQKNRIFSTATSKAALTLNHLKLVNGYHNEYGGAIVAGGLLDLFNVVLENNKADKMGGAVYLLGNASDLSANNSTWQQNLTNGGVGSALSMTCLADLKPTARNLVIQNSSFINNGSGNDQSILDICGNLTFNLQSSTIAENKINNSGNIINFNENTSPLSTVSFLNATIINNEGGSALFFGKLGTIQINHSILSFNQAKSCHSNLASSDINYSGDNNLYQGCDILKVASTTSTNAHPNDQHITFGSINWTELFNPLGNYGGYTQVYLPKQNALSKQYVVDKITSGACQDYIDQRGSNTHSTSNVENCDRGSVERRAAIAVVDRTALFTNKDKTDRIVEVNVLDNDIPSETDLTDDKENSRGSFAKDAEGNYQLKLTNDSGGLCTIRHRTSENLLPYVKFDNGGKLINQLQSGSCKYSFIDSNGNQAIEGQLFFTIENKLPIAGDDTFYLQAGASQITMNLTSNDNDDNDGKYGGLCTSNTVKCNGGYYIRVVDSPKIGTIEGESRPCPDYTDTNKNICYRGDLIYQSKNDLAPFNDKFTYVVYDNDLAFSAPATVTIISENAEKANDTGGSLAWWSLLSLAGLALYRRRNIKIA